MAKDGILQQIMHRVDRRRIPDFRTKGGGSFIHSTCCPRMFR